MPKPKSQKTNSSASKEIPLPEQPAIVRIVKQNTTNTTATSNNSPAPSESSSTAAPRENQKIVPELHLENNQEQSLEVKSSSSSLVPTANAVSPKTTKAKTTKAKAKFDIPLPAETATVSDIPSPTETATVSDIPLPTETPTVNVEELTVIESNKALDLAQPELDNKQPQAKKRIPPYNQLETVTNCSQQTFTVGEEIQVITSNFGEQQAQITSLYSAPDGIIWAIYHPLTKEQKQQWQRGCCRIEYLKKLDLDPEIAP
jgi:hypothetical protein